MNFISNFLITIMNFVYEYLSFGNYAVAIILFTLLIKVVLLPLDIKSRTSMRRMNAAQAGLKVINEKYKNDPEKRNQKTMEYYKKERVSPMGGCLPLLLTFPVLFAMWSVLRTVANEQTVLMFLNVQSGVADITAPDFLQSFFWVHNLWQPDNFSADGTIIPLSNALSQIQPVSGSSILTAANIENMHRNYTQVMQYAIEHYNGASMNGWGFLPVLVFGTQFLSQKLQPKPPENPDNKQGNMMKMMNTFMPVIFVFFCWGYSAAFSLYFAISNLYGVLENLALNWYFDKKEKGLQEGGAKA